MSDVKSNRRRDRPMPFQFVNYDKRGHIAYITINRPDVLNALHPTANQELFDIFTDFNEDPEAWTAILTGAGDRSFCVGSDIKWMAAHPGTVANFGVQEGGMTHREIWKPIIAAVNGYCLGGGLEIALACDLIIAAEHALFGVPEIRTVGCYPGEGGILRLPRQIPYRVAMDMLLTGRRIPAREALQLGLINQVVPASELMAAATAKAEEINANSPIAVRVSKEIVVRSLDRPLGYPCEHPRTAWDLYDELGPKLKESEDYRSNEGPRAFAEKRKPVWKGR